MYRNLLLFVRKLDKMMNGVLSQTFNILHLSIDIVWGLQPTYSVYNRQ